MIYRAFRRLDTEQWLDVMLTCEADEYPADPDAQVADLAAALEIDPELLEAVDDDTDPRSGTLLALPIVAAPAVPSVDEKIAELVDAVSVLTDLTFALLEGL